MSALACLTDSIWFGAFVVWAVMLTIAWALLFFVWWNDLRA